jgi:hypothetical protein
MAKSIARNVKIKVNGVDLSADLHKIEYNIKWDRVETSGMGLTYKQYLLGLGDAQITCDFFNDFSAGSVYATLQPLAGSNNAFEVEVTPDSTLPNSATNPRIVMFSVLDAFDPVAAQVGQAMMMNNVTFYNATQSGVLYYTT